MTATNFHDLLAGWLSGDPRFQPVPGDYADADEILALPAIDCPTCKGDREVVVTQDGMGETIHCHVQCPACAGTGKATVAQLLAWGSAVAQDPSDSDEIVEDWRNRILGVTP